MNLLIKFRSIWNLRLEINVNLVVKNKSINILKIKSVQELCVQTIVEL